MTIGVDIQSEMLATSFALPGDGIIHVELPAGAVSADSSASYREALAAARLALAELALREKELQAEARSPAAAPPLDPIGVWRERIDGLPDGLGGRRPSALEIAEMARALAVRLAGNGQGTVAANALALATVAARADVDGDSVSCVVNRLVGEY